MTARGRAGLHSASTRDEGKHNRETDRDTTLSKAFFTRIDPEVFLVCGRHQGRDSALVATWVVCVTLHDDRGRVLVALSPGSLTAEVVRASRCFVVQLLCEGQQMLIPRFGLASGREADKFDGIEVARSSSGLPVVAGTCGWAECEVIGELSTEERIVLLGRIVQEAVFLQRRPLRLSQIIQALPEDKLRAIEQQRQRHGERDQP
jgi:flavin reductase (DIM6/NTAB) family NADH-FMN oxidoreductase RutF